MEVMLILVVIGIMVSGIIPLFISVVQSNKSASYYSNAYRIADSKIEEYRRASFDGLTTNTFTISSLPSGQGTLTVTNNIDGAPQVDIKRLDLTIAWNYKKARSASISTYVTRNGVGR